MPTPKLKLNGKRFVLGEQSPTLDRMLAFLDAGPPDELFTSDQVAACGISENYIDILGRKEKAANYTQKVGRCKYYGHPKAIAELRRQLESR